MKGSNGMPALPPVALTPRNISAGTASALEAGLQCLAGDDKKKVLIHEKKIQDLRRLQEAHIKARDEYRARTATARQAVRQMVRERMLAAATEEAPPPWGSPRSLALAVDAYGMLPPKGLSAAPAGSRLAPLRTRQRKSSSESADLPAAAPVVASSAAPSAAAALAMGPSSRVCASLAPSAAQLPGPPSGSAMGGKDTLLSLGYATLGPIAAGAFSQVVRAKEMSTQREVAVKTYQMRSKGGKAPTNPVEAVFAEVAALKRLQPSQHPHVANLICSHDCKSVMVLALEYGAGGSLQRFLQKLGDKIGASCPEHRSAASPLVCTPWAIREACSSIAMMPGAALMPPCIDALQCRCWREVDRHALHAHRLAGEESRVARDPGRLCAHPLARKWHYSSRREARQSCLRFVGP